MLTVVSRGCCWCYAVVSMDVSDKIHESHGVRCHSVGVLEQRGRGGCSGDSGPATHGQQNWLPGA